MILSVVAPCFNEEEVLKEFYLRLYRTLTSLNISNYEIILVDDGSHDKTWDTILLLNEIDPKLRGIRLSRNWGHQAALTAGLQEASGEVIFIIDSDLQDPPELLGPMLDKMMNGFDVVYGKRRTRLGETAFKKISAFIFYRFLSLIAEVHIPTDTGDFRLINQRVLRAYGQISERGRFTRGLISWMGFRQTHVDYDRQQRYAGVSKYPIRKMINFAIDAIIGFSTRPLRIITILGTTLSMSALLFFLLNLNVLSLIFLIGSLQIFSIGLLGEYVGRSYNESRNRPLFLIQEITAREENTIELASLH